jgi:hypothetical protein
MNMKQIIIPFVGAVFMCLVACDGNDNDQTNVDSTSAGNPAAVQPPAENVPDSMQIQNDSVIVPKDSAGVRSDTSNTMRR